MLILREPLKLNIADNLTTVTDSFYERIVGNYSMMSAGITPKDLLFFLSTPPEIPDNLGGMTTFAIENSTTDNRSIAMDIINNVVNRIMLSESADFTYQDQVYINNVLNKLGITDVSVFMKQVSQLTEEHKAVQELISLYTQELKLRESSPYQRDEILEASESYATKEDVGARATAPLFLHSEIYKRLETGAIYDIVNSYQSDQTHISGTFHNNEIKTAEQLSVSKLLTLSKLKEQAVSGGALTLQHMINHFELGDILPPPQTEDDVLSQAAAASILATVEHAYVQKLFSKSERNKLWLSLEQSLSETVENTISRFQSFHTDNLYITRNSGDSNENTILKFNGEAQVLRELINLRRELGNISVNEFSELSSFADTSKLIFNQVDNNFTSESLLDIDSYIEHITNRTENQISDTNLEQIIRDKSFEIKTMIQSDIPAPGEISTASPVDAIHPAMDDEKPLTAEEILNIEKLNNNQTTNDNHYLTQNSGDSYEDSVSQNKDDPQISRELINLRRELGNVSVDMYSELNAFIESPKLTFDQVNDDLANIDLLGFDSYTDYSTNSTETIISDTVLEQIIKDKSFDLKTIIQSDIPSVGDSIAPAPIDVIHPALDDEGPLTAEELLILEKQKSILNNKEITEKTRSILSREIAAKQSRPQAPEPILVPEVFTHKTVREIELEYDIYEHSKLLQNIVNQKFDAALPDISDKSDQTVKPEPFSPALQKIWEQQLFNEGSNIAQNIYRDESRNITLNPPTEPEAAAAQTFVPASETDFNVSQTLLHHVSDREADVALLAHEVDEIERKNRERFESISISRIEKTANHMPTPDRAKTLSASLKALESPEAALQELLGAPAPMAHPTGAFTPEAEAYLSNADEATRKLFESVMRYEQNPQTAQQDKLFHVGNIGEFNAIAAMHPQPASSPNFESVKLQQDTVLINDRQEIVLEKFSESPARRNVFSNEQSLPPRVPIIHRQEQNQFSEELLERLDQQRNQVTTTQVINEEATNRQIHEITQNEINSQMVTQNAEDITRLVNQTLAKQMNTISDKVYHQMEKRLQTERSRRGRF